MTAGGAYHPLSPTRILDTRNGIGGRMSPLGTGESWSLAVAGQGGVPANAVAVVMNVTVTDTTSPSYLTLYPTGVTRPTASNLNWAAGQTIPNLVEVKLGTGGKVDLFNHAGQTDVVADLEGWVGPPQASTNSTGLYQPVVPARLLDTRDGTGGYSTPLAQGQSLHLQVTSRGGVPAAGVAGVVLDVTVTNATASSYLTAWPSGTALPLASNLNFVAGQTIPNRVMVKLDANGQVDLYNHAGSVDVVVDVNGWFSDGTTASAGSGFTGVTPSRILDTRSGLGGIASPVGAGGSIALQVAGRGGVPAMSASAPPKAVVLNVTATDTTAPSFLTVWPDGTSRPWTSDLNWIAGVTIPNLTVVRIGPDGEIDLYNHLGSADIVVDVIGYYN